MGLKNIEKAQVLRLGDEVEYQQGQIVSKTLAQNRALSMTLFAFEQDEEISTHTADGDALVTVLDGTGRPRTVRTPERRVGVLLIEIKVKADRCSHGRPKCDAAVWEDQLR